MSASREKRSTNATREVVAMLVRLRGLKRGLHAAAVALGVSESWARKIHYGEAQFISEEVAARARGARAAVIQEWVAASRREYEKAQGAALEIDLADSDAHCVSHIGLAV